MYIYEAKGLDFSGTKCNGLIVAPEKDGCDPFTPVAIGDTCLLVVPYFDDDTNTNAVAFKDDYTVAFSDSADPAINEGMKLFVFQGEVAGAVGGAYEKLKGLIFKPIQNQNEMNPIIEDGMIIFGIADEIDAGDGYEHLATPIMGQVTVQGTPSITIADETLTVEASKTATTTYETVPNIYDSNIAVTYSEEGICTATIKDGDLTITGVAEGTATVTLTIKGSTQSASVEVTVTQ